MKTLIKLFIIALFGIEILSPFMIGYLNQKQKTHRTQANGETQTITFNKTESVASNATKKDWMDIDYTEKNYSDSKTYTVME
jgi:hypothetical protein